MWPFAIDRRKKKNQYSISQSVLLLLLKNSLLPFVPQWGAADAEIKVPSGENTELKRSPYPAWSGRCMAMHATLAAREFFLAYFYLSSPFTCIFSKTSPNFFLCWPAE